MAFMNTPLDWVFMLIVFFVCVCEILFLTYRGVAHNSLCRRLFCISYLSTDTFMHPQISVHEVLVPGMFFQPMVGNFVRRIAMDVQRSSVLRESSVWTYQHLVWEQCVEIALMATLEMERNALVMTWLYVVVMAE